MNKSLNPVPENNGEDKQFFLMQFDIVKDISYLIRKYWVSITAMTLVFGILCASFTYYLNSNTGSVSIAFNYSEIGEGKNPDGTRFNIYELLTDEVLQSVVEKVDPAQTELSVDYLKNKLVIADKMTYTRMDTVEKSIVDGYENFTYHPSEFIISYSQSMGKYSADAILTALADSYRDYFAANHVEHTVALTPDLSQVYELDYINGVEKLRSVITSMRDYVAERQAENGTFKSTVTGLSFDDLKSRLDNMIEVDIPRYEAFIIKSSLSKDRTALLKQYKYAIRNDTMKRNTSDASYRTSMEGLDLYDQTVTKVVFIPSYDKDNEFYMSRTNTGIDYLTELAAFKMGEIGTLSRQISQYEYLIKNFGGSVDEVNASIPVTSEGLFGQADYTDSGVQEAYDESTQIRDVANDAPITYEEVPVQLQTQDEVIASADVMLSDIMTHTQELSGLALTTDSEYIRENQSCYPFYNLQEASFGSAEIRNIVIGFIASFIVAYLMIWAALKVIHYSEVSKQKREERLKNIKNGTVK